MQSNIQNKRRKYFAYQKAKDLKNLNLVRLSVTDTLTGYW